MPGEGLRVVDERLPRLTEYLGQLTRQGHTVLASNEGLSSQYLALPAPEEEAHGSGTVVFAERIKPSLVWYTVTEGQIVAGAVRRARRFPWRLEQITCSAGDIQLGDRAVLQDPATQRNYY